MMVYALLSVVVLLDFRRKRVSRRPRAVESE